MLKGKLGILFLTGCFLILANAPAVLCMTSEPVIYVAGDGSGDFNCDGKDDHIQINQALKFVAKNSDYTTVYLKGPFTYVIDDTILIGSDTTLEGDSDAVLKLTNNAGWESGKPMIKEMSTEQRDITICGFEIDGNCGNQPGVDIGKGYYDMITLSHAYNVNVYNMYLHDGLGDGIRIYHDYSDEYETVPTNINVYDNAIFEVGHDAIWIKHSSNADIYNNDITIKANSGVRITECSDIKIHNNKIHSNSKGFSGISVDKSMSSTTVDNIEIYGNSIFDSRCWGIWLYGCSKGKEYKSSQISNIHIHHNLIFNNSRSDVSYQYREGGGIVLQGFNALIENNVIDGNAKFGVACEYWSYSALGESCSPPENDIFTIVLRNNIITNTVKSTYKGDQEGYGIANLLPENHLLTLQNNDVWNSESGNYYGVDAGSSDIQKDPLFADNNYHLKSVTGRWDGSKWVKDSVNSPCIDAGCSSSDYSNEPENNGNIINIGRYGNTIYASKSGTALLTESSDSGCWNPQISEKYDNRLREASPETVYPDKPYLDLGNRPGVGDYREIMWFNLNEYASAEEISSATLYLYWYYPEGCSRPEDTVIEIYRPADSWDPEYVSWNKKGNGISWNNAGGDWYDKNGDSQGNTPYATITIKGSSLPDNRYYELDITDLVKEYVSGKYENTGFLIKTCPENSDYIAFYSLECGDENMEPKLDIVWI